MYFYKVLARLASYHGQEFLTYHSRDKLAMGTVVKIAVRRQIAPGIIMEQTSKPAFVTKTIADKLLPSPLPPTSLELIKWLAAYYPAPLGIIAQQFLPASLEVKSSLGQLSRSAGQTDDKPTAAERLRALGAVPLTPEQSQTLINIKRSAQTTTLLHGDTGTGKTRIYIELAAESLRSDRSALILTPEIGLTAQLLDNFTAVFGSDNTILLHSTLTPPQRRQAWLRILETEQPLVIIGPRSALFAPIKHLGLVVMDEFHESAYKQEQAPYYQAVRVAAQLARLHGSRLILGSATPTVQDYYYASGKNIPILRMEQMAINKNPAPSRIEIVDLRDKAQLKRSPYLSERLLQTTQETLDAGGQALLFLNRRGTARVVLCLSCGWQATCPHCALPLTYHGDTHLLICHTCGHKQLLLTTCPTCSGTDILLKSAGTKSVVESLERLFPGKRIQRFDADSKKAERLERHYDSLVSGEVDILVGTQLLTKGLDLPKLGLVGVISADSSLHFPDYTAEEKTFQLLTQVIGRVNRGHRAGRAVIQSYTPDNPTLKAVVSKDWDGFYAQQLERRQLYNFPPFCYLLKLSVARVTQKSAQAAAEKLTANLRSGSGRIEIVGPSPSYYEKIGGKHRWQLVIKAKERGELLKIIAKLPAGWSYDLDPADLL